jgi:hypothetical protein
MATSVSSEDNLDWAGDTGAQSGGGADDSLGGYTSQTSGITSLLTPFKGIFDRLKSGNTTANDVNAALGVLGLLMPSLNRPQTKGWKGSIDLTKQYNRTPIAQPAYTPYAQSASPVMGRQFFNTTYGAAPAPAPTPAPSPSIPAPAPVEQAAAPTYSAASAPSAAPAAAPIAAPVAAPTAAPTPAPVAAPVASPAPAARAGIASLSSSNTAVPAVRVAAPAPAPNISKYSAWDTYINNPNFAAFNTPGKEQWNTALSNAYASPGSNLWGVQNLSAPEVAQYLRSKNLLTDQEIAAVHQQFQPRPAPGLSYDRNSEGWGEYFTPEGQFRRFTSTGTPISPMTYPVGTPASLGTPGAMINPYNIAASNLGFMPDSPAYRQELRNKTFAEGGVANLFGDTGPKQPKIALFGDSISSSVGYGKDSKSDTKYGNTVADVLSKQLGVPVDLQAVGGATTKDALTSNYLPGGNFEKYLQDNKPDVVLLRFGAADAIRLNDPQQTLANLQSMVDLAKQYGATPVMIGVSPFAPGNDIRAGNINEWSVDPYVNSASVINQGIQDIANQNKLPFVDMQRLEVPQGSLLDGVHPTAAFGKTMADYIGQAVSSALPQFGGSYEKYQQFSAPPQNLFQQMGDQFAEPQMYGSLQDLVGQQPGSYETGLDLGMPPLTPQAGYTWTGQGGMGADIPQMGQPTMQAGQPTARPLEQPSGISQLVAPPQPMPQPMPQPEPPRFPMPEFQPDDVMAAQGGMMGYARGGRANRPRYLRGETDGMQDRIPSNIDGVQPAKLSHGEFVIPADVVSHLGNGNSDAGAKVLYKMMDRVRHARTGNKKQGRQINPEKFTPGGIAGYAGGGAVAFQTGGTAIGGSGATSAPLGTSTETNISEWAGPYVGDMLSKTAALTNTPYQAYQGPMVAGTAPLQSKVFGGLESLNFPGQLGQSFTAQGAYQLPSMTPGGMTGQATGPTGIASQYMNPYLSAVLTPQLEELRRQSQITQMNTAGKLAQAGAFGGSRQAIMDAETQRNLLQEQNKAIGTGYANAYDRAMGQFNTEQGQAKTLADMMAGAGTQQRGIEQEGITALQKQYETELLDPFTKLRFQKEMLQGLPVATASTTANTSQMGEFKGGLSDLAEALKKLGLG